jgi:hypothetical protein
MRVELVPADPVLPVAKLTSATGRARRLHQNPVKRHNVPGLERPVLRTELHCFFHRGNVAEHRTGGLVACLRSFGLGLRESSLREHQALDARRCHRLGSEQTAREGLEAGHRRRIPVEQVHLPLGCRNRRRDLGGQGKLEPGDGVRNERLVTERLALFPRAGHARVGSPCELNESRHAMNLDQQLLLVKVSL